MTSTIQNRSTVEQEQQLRALVESSTRKGDVVQLRIAAHQLGFMEGVAYAQRHDPCGAHQYSCRTTASLCLVFALSSILLILIAWLIALL